MTDKDIQPVPFADRVQLDPLSELASLEAADYGRSDLEEIEALARRQHDDDAEFDQHFGETTVRVGAGEVGEGPEEAWTLFFGSPASVHGLKAREIMERRQRRLASQKRRKFLMHYA